MTYIEIMNREGLADVLPYLPVLVALGEVEHVTVAAAMLQMPQPTVSRIVRRLEHRLDVRLLEPDGRGVRLTDAARSFIPYAQRALDTVADGLDVLQSRHQLARSTVRIAFQTSLGERFVPEVIRSVRRTHPGIRFVLSQGARRKCLDMLVGGDTDIAMVSGLKPPPEGLDVIDLFEQPLCVLVADDHPRADASALRIRDLAVEPVITLKSGFGLRGSLDELFSAAGILPSIAFEGDDPHTMRGLVASGLGVAISPWEDVPWPGCVQIPIAGVDARRDLGAAVLSTARTDFAVTAVLDVLVATASRRRRQE